MAMRSRRPPACGRLVPATGRPPVISRPISWMSAVSDGKEPTIRPSYMTTTRSDRDRISSSSSEISTIATPAARRSSRTRWTASIPPTSSPRVGWTATIRRGLESISRAKMSRCRLPTAVVTSRIAVTRPSASASTTWNEYEWDGRTAAAPPSPCPPGTPRRVVERGVGEGVAVVGQEDLLALEQVADPAQALADRGVEAGVGEGDPPVGDVGAAAARSGGRPRTARSRWTPPRRSGGSSP